MKFTRARVQVSGSFSDISPTNVNCSTATDTVVNGVITKFGSLCDLTFVYTWTGACAQDGLGQAYDYKEFSLALIDLSGNISVDSSRVVVYNDRSAATKFDSYLSSKDTTKPIIGAVDSITRADELELVIAGEKNSDAEIEVIKDGVAQNLGNTISILGDNNVVYTTSTRRVVRFGNVTDNLGNVVSKMYMYNCTTNCTASTTVDESGVKTYIKIPTDGLYQIKYRLIDTAGNKTAWQIKTITRDTTAPVKPVLTYTKTDNTYSTNVSLNISGETGVKANILVNGVKYFGVSNNSYNYSLMCGRLNTLTVSLEDRAGNLSEVSTLSIQSVSCPVVTISANPSLPETSTSIDVIDLNTLKALDAKRYQIINNLINSDQGYMRCGGKMVESTMNLNPLTTSNLFTWTPESMIEEIKTRCEYSNLSQVAKGELDNAIAQMLRDLKQIAGTSLYSWYGKVSGDWILHTGWTTGSTVQCTGYMSNLSDWLSSSAIGSGKKCTDEQKKAWQDVLPITTSIVVGALCGSGALLTLAICAGGVAVVMGTVNGIVQYSEKGYIDVGEMGYTLMMEFVATFGIGLAIKVISRVGGVVVKYLVKTGKGSVQLAETAIAKNLTKEEVEAMLKANSGTAKEIVEVTVGTKTFTKLTSGMLADDAIRPAITASNVDEQALRYLGKTFKIELNGITKEVTIPVNFKYVLAEDGKGLVFYDASKYTSEIALKESRGIYRIANPQFGNYPNPNGKFRYYTEGQIGGTNGQPLDINGEIGSDSTTHFNLLGY